MNFIIEVKYYANDKKSSQRKYKFLNLLIDTMANKQKKNNSIDIQSCFILILQKFLIFYYHYSLFTKLAQISKHNAAH